MGCGAEPYTVIMPAITPHLHIDDAACLVIQPLLQEGLYAGLSFSHSERVDAVNVPATAGTGNNICGSRHTLTLTRWLTALSKCKCRLSLSPCSHCLLLLPLLVAAAAAAAALSLL
jgi:hypothetical protein